jgi:hypothetical protein
MEAVHETGLLSFRDYRRERPLTPVTTRSAISTPEPAWLNSIERQCWELTNLPANWDTYGAHPVNPITAAAAVEFLRRIVPSSLKAPPTVVPTSAGGLQFEWNVGGHGLEVDFAGPAQVSILYSGQDAEWEKDLAADLTPLSEVLARIASPE